MLDSVEIYVNGGNGGDGIISGRREKYVPRGGPDGGDGGKGGSVYLVCTQSETTLSRFRYKKRFVAGSGGHGEQKKRHGKDGKSIEIPVPLGTEIWEGDAKLEDLTIPGDRTEIAAGGRGGRGNARFTTSTNRYPVLAEEGDLGIKKVLRLELKLIADVGIVGAPNAGKSSLLASVSAARPKVAAYPFTTLEPVLGVVEWKGTSFVMVDIPGLIEGAHEGVGLGHTFLKHVERTRMIIHVVDGSSTGAEETYEQIRNELRQFGTNLESKPEITAVNKIDIPQTEARCKEIQEKLKELTGRSISISAATGEGVGGLLDEVITVLDAAAPAAIKEQHGTIDEDGVPVLRPKEARSIPQVIRLSSHTYRVKHRPVERLAAMVNEKDWTAMVQFLEQLRRHGVVSALEAVGVIAGDTIRIGDIEWEWE